MRILESGYTVRRVNGDMAAGLSVVHKSCFNPAWQAHDFSQFLERDSCIALAAFLQGKGQPVAFILLRLALDEAEIISIGVMAKHRRRNIAVALLDAAIDQLEEAGITSLYLEVSEANKAAIKLYERFGFERVGERKSYYGRAEGKESANALMMRFNLDSD